MNMGNMINCVAKISLQVQIKIEFTGWFKCKIHCKWIFNEFLLVIQKSTILVSIFACMEIPSFREKLEWIFNLTVSVAPLIHQIRWIHSKTTIFGIGILKY